MSSSSGQLHRIGVYRGAFFAPCADRGRPHAHPWVSSTAAAFAGTGPVTVLFRGKVQVEDIPPTRAMAP